MDTAPLVSADDTAETGSGCQGTVKREDAEEVAAAAAEEDAEEEEEDEKESVDDGSSSVLLLLLLLLVLFPKLLLLLMLLPLLLPPAFTNVRPFKAASAVRRGFLTIPPVLDRNFDSRVEVLQSAEYKPV